MFSEDFFVEFFFLEFFFLEFFFVEFFFGSGIMFVPKRGFRLVRCGGVVMTSESGNALRVVWFAFIVLAAVVVAVVTALATILLHAPALVVLSSTAIAFTGMFGLGIAVHNFFRTS